MAVPQIAYDIATDIEADAKNLAQDLVQDRIAGAAQTLASDVADLGYALLGEKIIAVGEMETLENLETCSLLDVHRLVVNLEASDSPAAKGLGELSAAVHLFALRASHSEDGIRESLEAVSKAAHDFILVAK